MKTFLYVSQTVSHRHSLTQTLAPNSSHCQLFFCTGFTFVVLHSLCGLCFKLWNSINFTFKKNPKNVKTTSTNKRVTKEIHSSIKHKNTVDICGDTVNKHSVELKEAHQIRPEWAAEDESGESSRSVKPELKARLPVFLPSLSPSCVPAVHALFFSFVPSISAQEVNKFPSQVPSRGCGENLALTWFWLARDERCFF